MATSIRKVDNQTLDRVHLILFSESIDRNYDLVLDPSTVCWYDELFENAKAPVPVATDQKSFQDNHIELYIGMLGYAIYQSQEKTRLTRLINGSVTLDTFLVDAPPIPGHSGSGTVDLILVPAGPKMVVVNDTTTQQLAPHCGWHLAVPGDGSVYFQGGSGHSGLYKVPIGGGKVDQLDDCCGRLVYYRDYIYFQGTSGENSLFRVRANGKPGEAEPLDKHCGALHVPGDGYVYFQGGSGHSGLFRRPIGGGGEAQQLDNDCGEHFTIRDGYIYFQGGGGFTHTYGLFRRPIDGSSKAHLDSCCWALQVPGDGYVYFRGGGIRFCGLYRVPINGKPGDAQQLDDDCGEYFAIRDGYVYFQGAGGLTHAFGLYRVPIDGKPGDAQQLDQNCGRLEVPGDGYVYFQGGPELNSLYRIKIQGVTPPQKLYEGCRDFVIPENFGANNKFIYIETGGLYKLQVLDH